MRDNILNTEIWRDIAGYEGIYQVSNLGMVKIVSEETRIKMSNRAKIRERDEKGRYICYQ